MASKRLNGGEMILGDFEEQREKNMHILKLIRDDHGWALSRILLAEQLEAERDALREALEYVMRWMRYGEGDESTAAEKTDAALALFLERTP